MLSEPEPAAVLSDPEPTTMPSKQEIAARLAHISALLTAGGKNAQMKEWYYEYKRLDAELKVAKRHVDNSAQDYGQGPAEKEPEDQGQGPADNSAVDHDQGLAENIADMGKPPRDGNTGDT